MNGSSKEGRKKENKERENAKEDGPASWLGSSLPLLRRHHVASSGAGVAAEWEMCGGMCERVGTSGQNRG